MNFFKDLFDEAFSNDESLPSDRSQSQLEGPGDASDYETSVFSSAPKTDIQKRWLEQQQLQEKQRKNEKRGAAFGSGGRGAPVDPTVLHGTVWVLDLFLAGVPDRDPSSDLYGSKVNISTKQASSDDDTPSVSVRVTLNSDGSCTAEESAFTVGPTSPGQWKLSDDSKAIRISMDCTGYTRTIRTKGTLTKVYWSDGENEVSTKTTSTSRIPPGLIYCDINIGYGLPGEVIMGGDQRGRRRGVLRVEKVEGILGARTRMVDCGTFKAELLKQDEEKKGML